MLHILRPLLSRVVYLRQFRPVVPFFVGPCFILVTWTYIPLRLIDMLITLEYRSGFQPSREVRRGLRGGSIFRPNERENSPGTRPEEAYRFAGSHLIHSERKGEEVDSRGRIKISKFMCVDGAREGETEGERLAGGSTRSIIVSRPRKYPESIPNYSF